MKEGKDTKEIEIQSLREQLTVLRREKANLQMAANLINQISQITGVGDVIERILQILVSAVGGSNISIYYTVEGAWRYADVLGEKKQLDSIDDETVRQSVEQKKFIKVQEKGESNLTIPGFPRTYETWVYPLQVHNFFFGAIRLQGMAIEHAHYRANIDPFIQYSALVLYHEVSNLKKLQSAYDEVSQAKEQLQKSKEQFELAMKFTNDGLFDWNLETDEIYFSPVWKGLLGYGDDEIKNALSEWKRFLKPEDVKESWKMLTEILKGKRGRFEKEFQMRHKDGHWVDMLSRANVLFNEKGQGVRVVGTHVDISKLKKIENSLRDSEAKFSKAFHRSPMLMTISSIEDGRYQEVNDAFVHITGYKKEEAIGVTSIEMGLISDTERQRIVNELKTAGRVHNLELELRKADGSKLICLYSGEVIEVEGKPRLLSIASDVTDQKRTEKHLRDVQKRESIGNLAGGIAHDFNNILFPIMGMSELLIEDLPENSPERENAEEILKAGKRGSDLVKQILAFSRQTEHKIIPMRIQSVLKEAIKLLRSTIPSNIQIEQNIPTDVGLMMADPTQIHQVFMNLITNAYHAVENTNNAKISVDLEKIWLNTNDALDPGQYALLTISDNGCGIAPGIMDRIFEPYFTTKEQGKGTGLGLAMVHGIIKDHKGDIKVSSELGKGTAFKVYFPLLDHTERTNVQKDITTEKGGTEKILLVDDEESIARLEKQMLERLGYSVTACFSSLDALNIFQADPSAYNLVITDMTMPKMTGDQLAEKLISLRRDLPIVICTGYSEKMDDEKSKAIGFKGLLMKPVVKIEMAQMVRKVLDESKKS
jgi:PAS domain S-box-containing protein